MEKVKEKIKLGTSIRKLITETISYEDAPKDVKKIYDNSVSLNEYNSNTKFKIIKYNGGGDLVNYGLNTFVRDIYIHNKGIVAYSDRFGIYSKIYDKDIVNLITNSNVLVTPEGIILFYSNYSIYATLNCKAGYMVDIGSLFTEIGKEYKLSKVFCSNKNTYIEAVDIVTNQKSYYILIFSFDLYDAYSTQVKVQLEKIGTEYSYEDIVNKKFFDDDSFEECDNQIVDTSNKILNISTVNTNLNSSEYKKIFGKKAGYIKRKEHIDGDRTIFCTNIFYDGDIGIDNSINSFVKSLTIARPYIAEGFWNFIFGYSNIRNVLFQLDRFNTCYIYTDNINSIFDNLKNCKLYVSNEGVIIATYSIKNCIYISFSLDGVVWKKYNLSDIIKTSKKIESVLISYKYDKNILTIYECNEYDTSHTDNTSSTQEYTIDFVFDFWSLYNSPVEVIFNIVEL